MLRFSDGVNIDTSGPLRRLKLHDGLYVVGNGYSIPMNSEKEVQDFLDEHKPKPDPGYEADHLEYLMTER